MCYPATMDAVLTDASLRRDDDGSIRVGDSRVLLETVLAAFDAGSTPEQIIVSFPTLLLADVYAAITFALRHTQEVAEYRTAHRSAAVRAEERAEAAEPMAAVRDRLLARSRQAS